MKPWYQVSCGDLEVHRKHRDLPSGSFLELDNRRDIGNEYPLSSSSGIEGLFDLIVQVLRLGRADLRLIVERVLGKKFMELVDKGLAAGEKLLEPVTILLDKGPVALWEYLKDSLGDLIQSGIDRIKDTVFFTFVEKALKWVAGFFIPGGGFVKIVKAIFSAFQFVVENLDNIRHFFEAVFDSMEAAIEKATPRALPARSSRA